jgi:TPR repeat protein
VLEGCRGPINNRKLVELFLEKKDDFSVYLAAMLLDHETNDSRRLELLSRAANSCDYAKAELGRAFLLGRGVEVDLPKGELRGSFDVVLVKNQSFFYIAIQLLNECKNNPFAQCMLAECFWEGHVEKDRQHAISLYLSAAKKEWVKAEHRLSEIYLEEGNFALGMRYGARSIAHGGCDVCIFCVCSYFFLFVFL